MNIPQCVLNRLYVPTNPPITSSPLYNRSVPVEIEGLGQVDSWLEIENHIGECAGLPGPGNGMIWRRVQTGEIIREGDIYLDCADIWQETRRSGCRVSICEGSTSPGNGYFRKEKIVVSKYPHVICSAVLFRKATVLGPDGEPKEVTAWMSIHGFNGYIVALPELPDGQIWRECIGDDFLQPGDIFLGRDNRWDFTRVIGVRCAHPNLSHNSYFRQEEEFVPSDVLSPLADGWRVLRIGETRRIGDLCWDASLDIWHATDAVGTQVSGGITYLRKDKP